MTASPGRVLFAASLGFFVVILDVTIVNVALPSIGDDLGADLSDLQWVVDAYVVTFAALLLSSGALGDRIGVARCYSVGMVAFILASLACGAAPSLGVLLAARVVQGAAAALLLPSSLALVLALVLGPGRSLTRSLAPARVKLLLLLQRHNELLRERPLGRVQAPPSPEPLRGARGGARRSPARHVDRAAGRPQPAGTGFGIVGCVQSEPTADVPIQLAHLGELAGHQRSAVARID